MADVLARLAGPITLTAAAVTQYTSPAAPATVTTVTNIHVANETAAQQTFTLSVGLDAAGKRFFYQVPVDAGDAFDWTGQLVLEAGDLIQAYASATAALTLTVSGVQTA